MGKTIQQIRNSEKIRQQKENGEKTRERQNSRKTPDPDPNGRSIREKSYLPAFKDLFGLPMREDVIIVGLLVILTALILRMRTKYWSERIQTVGFVILGIVVVVVGLIVN